MKTNKGFALVPVLLIILGVIILGGIAYYAGTKNSSAPQNTQGNNYYTPVDQNSSTTINSITNTTNTTQNQQAGCNSSSPASVKLISPNGGEMYQAGQKITVKWVSCNLKQSVGITLSGFPYPNDIQFFLGNWVASSIGSQTVTIPSTIQYGKYAINISTPPESSPSAEGWSDNFFTINAIDPTVGRVCGGGVMANGGACPNGYRS